MTADRRDLLMRKASDQLMSPELQDRLDKLEAAETPQEFSRELHAFMLDVTYRMQSHKDDFHQFFWRASFLEKAQILWLMFKMRRHRSRMHKMQKRLSGLG